MKRFLVIGLVCATCVTGCIAVGGSDRIEAREPTIGKQLQDLKTARDTGAITQEEYDRTKQAIMTTADRR
jgi:hypothetical protein